MGQKDAVGNLDGAIPFFWVDSPPCIRFLVEENLYDGSNKTDRARFI